MSDDAPAVGSSAAAALSGDGSVLAYRSSARNLVAGGTTLQVRGEGFTAGTTVTIGGVAAAVTVVDGTRLDVITATPRRGARGHRRSRARLRDRAAVVEFHLRTASALRSRELSLFTGARAYHAAVTRYPSSIRGDPHVAVTPCST